MCVLSNVRVTLSRALLVGKPIFRLGVFGHPFGKWFPRPTFSGLFPPLPHPANPASCAFPCWTMLS